PLPAPRLHADRPPSPTRRSSDLREFLRQSVGFENELFSQTESPQPAPSAPSPRFFLYGGSAGRLDNCLPPPAAASRRNMPSIEHTSELQSRFDLVCRLLLEKKKKHAIQQKEQRIHTGTGDDKTE